MQTIHSIRFGTGVERHPIADHLVPGAQYWASDSGLAFWREVERMSRPLIDASRPTRRAIPDGSPRACPGVDYNGKRVGYVLHGGFGDVLIHTAVLHQLKLSYPAIELHAFAMPRVMTLLHGNADVGGMGRSYDGVIRPALVDAMDHWIIPNRVGLKRRGTEENIYDLLETEIGIRIETKLPYVWITEPERRALDDLLAPWFSAGSKRLITIQVNASEPGRTPQRWFERLLALRATFPEHLFVLCGDVGPVAAIEEEFAARGLEIPGEIVLIVNGASQGMTPKGLCAVVERSDLVICPDSFLLHAAAAFDVPTIALWRFDAPPEDRIPPPCSRIATYSHAHAINMQHTVHRIIDLARALIRRPHGHG